MQFDAAVIKEQGVIFAVVAVKPFVLNSSSRETTRSEFSRLLGNIPTILMAQNSRGIPTYHGRRDIVNFLSHVHPSRIPWKRFTA